MQRRWSSAKSCAGSNFSYDSADALLSRSPIVCLTRRASTMASIVALLNSGCPAACPHGMWRFICHYGKPRVVMCLAALDTARCVCLTTLCLLAAARKDTHGGAGMCSVGVGAVKGPRPSTLPHPMFPQA